MIEFIIGFCTGIIISSFILVCIVFTTSRIEPVINRTIRQIQTRTNTKAEFIDAPNPLQEYDEEIRFSEIL